MKDVTDTVGVTPRAEPQRSQRAKHAWNIIERWIAAMHDALARLASPYRPERHYMRGGGTGGVS
jgi:hypothetical protein